MYVIVKRHKSTSGITIGYTLSDGKGEMYLNKELVNQIASQILNATLLNNGEFRAKSGCTIDTVIDNNNLVSVVQRPTLPKINSESIELDYYGKKYINICKRIRNYAISGKLTIDTSKHKSNGGKNTHLFKLIEACGVELKSFVRGYLSTIQPYSLSDFQGSKNINDSIWLCDIGYNISLVIKVNESDKNKPIVVSFHESNFKGNFTRGHKNFSDKPCAVIVDKVVEVAMGYGIDYTVQRGFIRYNVHSATKYYKNGIALVDYNDIVSMFNDSINLLFEQMRDTYLDLNPDNDVPVVWRRININELSFMSVGLSVVNCICLLIDLYAYYTDNKRRSILLEITNNIVSEIPEDRLNEIKIALVEKFEGIDNKLYKLLIEG